MRIWAAVFLLLVATPSSAKTAAQYFTAGDFASAAVQGQRENTAAGHIIAGRGLSVIAAWQTPTKAGARALLQDAEAEFNAALALSPGNLDAMLQKGIVEGYLGKIDRSPGLARNSRKQFETVLKQRPNDITALCAMGSWHGVTVATLGKFMAASVLGARADDAIRYLDKSTAPKDAPSSLLFLHATTLLALSADNAEQAKALLARSVQGQAQDGLERLLQAHSRAILEPLRKGDVAAARAVSKRLSPLGTVR